MMTKKAPKAYKPPAIDAALGGAGWQNKMINVSHDGEIWHDRVFFEVARGLCFCWHPEDPPRLEGYRFARVPPTYLVPVDAYAAKRVACQVRNSESEAWLSGMKLGMVAAGEKPFVVFLPDGTHGAFAFCRVDQEDVTYIPVPPMPRITVCQ